MRYVRDNDKSTSPGSIFGGPVDNNVFLQFVPGRVDRVFTSTDTPSGISENDVNSILAYTDYGNNLPLESISTEQYFPLLRGLVDVPSKDDMVLLTNFDGRNFYLGPINKNNSPNANSYNPGDIDILPDNFEEIITNETNDLGVVRLGKFYNKTLDKTDNDIHGDMVLEGKHGNSIRLGSRDVNPYMFFSNGRDFRNEVESTFDGSLISITETGTLRNHFQFDSIIQDNQPILSLFVLSSDKIDEKNINQNVDLIGDFYNYDYDKNQILLNSSRITINSRDENLFLSSFFDTTISSGNNIRIQSNFDTTINGNSIFIGRNSVENEPLVRGAKLVEILSDILKLLKSATTAFPAPQPVLWNNIPTNPPGATEGQNFSVEQIETKLNNLLSDIGFIESENRG